MFSAVVLLNMYDFLVVLSRACVFGGKDPTAQVRAEVGLWRERRVEVAQVFAFRDEDS